MDRWFETERYQALVKASRAMDHVAQARIIDAALSETEGAEKAFWLLLQRERRWSGTLQRASGADQVWTELREILSMAPDDPKNRYGVVRQALVSYYYTERKDLWSEFFPLIRRDLGPVLREGKDHHIVAMLRLLQRRWCAALRCSSRMLAAFQAAPPAVLSAQRGRLVFFHAVRATAAAACGHLELASADVQRAMEVDAEFVRGYLEPYPLVFAQAEVALARGDFRAAQAALQEGIARSAVSQYKPRPADKVKFDLVAARIARAEGNMVGFHNFCNRALANCHDFDLRMSEITVRAIMAGAER